MGSQDAIGKNPTNSVTIQNHFAGAQYPVEQIMACDHKVMVAADAGKMVQALSGQLETWGARSLYDVSMVIQRSYWSPVAAQVWKTDAKVDALINAMAQLVQPGPAGTTPTIADTQNRVTTVLAANAMV